MQVTPHSDLCNYMLTVHLGLRVPEGCKLFMFDGGPPVSWAAGALSGPFQTSFRHAAVNDSPEQRIILYFDIFHPELSNGERAALQMFDKIRKGSGEE